MAMYPTAQLRAFVEVAAEASFTRAAERLDISQPTASQLVRSLEKRVGAPLFVRGSRRVELTAAGRALLPHAERALALDAEAEAAVDRAASVERARLWVAAGEALATYVLPPALADLKHRLPRLEAGVIVGDVARILSALRSGEADAVLLTEHTAPADLESTVYARGRTVLLAAASEPVPDRPLEVADLAERTLIVRDPGTVNRREIDGLLERAEGAARRAAGGVQPGGGQALRGGRSGRGDRPGDRSRAGARAGSAARAADGEAGDGVRLLPGVAQGRGASTAGADAARAAARRAGLSRCANGAPESRRDGARAPLSTATQPVESII